jgi:hypothetical protein
MMVLSTSLFSECLSYDMLHMNKQASGSISWVPVLYVLRNQFGRYTRIFLNGEYNPLAESGVESGFGIRLYRSNR